jgi:RNA polymerase sigma-70 factor (ECF subfamily)
MFGIKRKQYKLKTDDELVNLYKIEQSSLCIAIIYERYGHLVLGVSLKYLKNQQDAQDLTMKVFEELPEKILKHSIQYFKSWLYMVTKNECFMLLRKKGIETSTEFIEKYEGEINEEDEPMKEIQLQLLEQSIELLKPEQKICITLFYIKELSYQEISEELNIPLMKVKSAIQNGKRNIKIQLEEKDEFKIEK